MSHIGDERSQPWFWIKVEETKLLRTGLVKGDPTLITVRSVYMALVEVANEERARTDMDAAESATFSAMRKKIASRSGASTKSVDRVTEALERLGMLRVERTRVEGDRNLPNRYVLCDPTVKQGDSDSPTPDSESGNQGDSESRNRGTSTTDQQPPVTPPTEVERLWTCYCVTFGKKGKAAELREDEAKIIRAALGAGEVEEIEACITACERSDYHTKRGKYARREGQRYTSLGKILKPRPRWGETQRSRIEWWLEIAEKQAGGENFNPNDYAKQMRREQGLDS